MKAKVAIVTGANGGLGTHVTQAFLDAGATVIGTARKIQQSEHKNSNFTAMPADISTREGARLLVDQVLARFGRLDILAHTVGGFAGGQPVAMTDDTTFQKMIERQSKLRVSHAAGRNSGAAAGRERTHHRNRQPGGAGTGANIGAYSASKAAMVSLIRTAALENKDAGLTANVILPGTMDTPANRQFMANADFSKWIQPAAIASLITWLASEAGKDVNGAVIPVYGSDV